MLTAAGRTVGPTGTPGVGWGRGGGGSQGAGLGLKGTRTGALQPNSTEAGEGAGPSAARREGRSQEP